MSAVKRDVDVCDVNTIHDDVVQRVSAQMPELDILKQLGDVFKVFGDATRLRILSALLAEEMCVCDIAALLGMTKSAVSHQLRILKQSNLVKNRREGREVYYSIADEHVETIINNGMDHILED